MLLLFSLLTIFWALVPSPSVTIINVCAHPKPGSAYVAFRLHPNLNLSRPTGPICIRILLLILMLLLILLLILPHFVPKPWRNRVVTASLSHGQHKHNKEQDRDQDQDQE